MGLLGVNQINRHNAILNRVLLSLGACMMCQRLGIVLTISAHEFVQYYQNTVDAIVTTSTDSRTVKFLINILGFFVNSNGMRGQFELVFIEP